MTDDEILAMAAEPFTGFSRRLRRMEDFRYDERQEQYWDTTTGTLLGSKSVDGAIPLQWWPTKENAKGDYIPYPPSKAINAVETGLTVEGSTWWPGLPRFIFDVVIDDRGVVPVRGACCYNTYTPPDHSRLRTDGCHERWLAHVKLLWPEEHEHFLDYAAHMLQRPHEKINHGIVIAGAQGIGKDTVLLPLRKGVGEHNTAEISPDDVTSGYNPYVKSVMLIINEVRPHDEDHKASSFYDQLKPILAAPPEMLPMEVKYANVVYVRNLMHTFLTTNDPLRMYIPAEDRRLFVMTSRVPGAASFDKGYFRSLHKYLRDGGTDAVIRWLLSRDISAMDVGEAPAMTRGKASIIGSADQVRRTYADELIEEYIESVFGGNRPLVVFSRDLTDWAATMFDDRKDALAAVKSRSFHFKMEAHGYDMLRPPASVEWAKGKFRSRTAFVCKSVPLGSQDKMVFAELERRPLKFDYSS